MAVRRSRRVPLALRRMRVHRTVLAAVVLTVALTTSFAAAIIMYSSRAGDAAVRSALQSASGTAIAFSGASPTEPDSQATAEIRSGVGNALGGANVTVYAAPELDLNLADSANSGRRGAMLLAPQDLAAHGRLLTGSWPGAGTASGISDVPIALDQAAATALHLSVGGHVSATTDDGSTATFRVTGVFAPIDPTGAYWALDPLAGTGSQESSGYTTIGPFFADALYLAHGPLAAQQMEWEAVPDIQTMGSSGLAAHATALSALFSRLSLDDNLGHPGASTQLPQLLAKIAPAALVAQSLVYAELLELLVVALAALFIVVRLLSEVRETEAALLWARGGSGTQLIRLRTMESVLLAAPAVIAAPFVAGPLASAIADVGGATGVSLPHAQVPAAVWVGVAGCALAAIAVILAPAFSSAVSPTALRSRQSRQAAVTA